jgi:hypothetical protein
MGHLAWPHGRDACWAGQRCLSALLALGQCSTIGLGAVAAVIGLMLFLLPSGSASIGWFAYQPLSDTFFLPQAYC